jgi:hypothetical protein
MHQKLPTQIQSLADEMFKGRQSPEPAAEDIRNDTRLNDLICDNGDELQVTKYFESNFLKDPQESNERLQGLDYTQFFSIHREHVPDNPENALSVSQPKPDILYGYIWEAFTSTQQSQLTDIKYVEYTANNQELIYPFLVIELKGDGLGPIAGSLWVATNQCLGGAAACINMVEKLNESVKQLLVSLISTTVFSIAMNNSEARLYISWKEGERYYTQQIEGLLVYKPQDYLVLRRFIRNVLQWGKDYRRPQIGAVLDALRERRSAETSI